MNNKISNELQRKMLNAKMSAKFLVKRDLKCPYCDYKIGSVFSDTKGHIEKKCPKCKEILLFFIHPETGCDFRRRFSR